MSKQKIILVLGDMLPTNYDAAIALFSVCHKRESEKKKDCISSYADALIVTWTKAFGEAHVKKKENIIVKVKQVVNHYNNHVFIEKSQTVPKRIGIPMVKKNIRILNKEWKQMSMTITKNRKHISIPINGLLDCGKEMDNLTGIEKDFYIDQMGARIGRMSESIDVDYVNEMELAAKMSKF